MAGEQSLEQHTARDGAGDGWCCNGQDRCRKSTNLWTMIEPGSLQERFRLHDGGAWNSARYCGADFMFRLSRLQIPPHGVSFCWAITPFGTAVADAGLDRHYHRRWVSAVILQSGWELRSRDMAFSGFRGSGLRRAPVRLQYRRSPGGRMTSRRRTNSTLAARRLFQHRHHQNHGGLLRARANQPLRQRTGVNRHWNAWVLVSENQRAGYADSTTSITSTALPIRLKGKQLASSTRRIFR